MQVFKTYFKIIKKQAGMLSIYIFIFLGLSIMFSVSSPAKDIENFTQSKTRVVFINEDGNSKLVEGFKEYLGRNSVFVAMPDSTDKLQDALYFRDVDYIARIPKGFTSNFIVGKPAEIGKTVVAGTTNGIYTDMLVNKYFNTAKLYLKNYKDITQEKLVEQVAKDLKAEANVQMKTAQQKNLEESSTKFYFNYLAYILICVIMLGVSSIMMIFNNKNLKRRNLCSPIKNTSMNFQLLLGNIVFATICWGLMVILSIVLYREQMFTRNAFYLYINSYVFTLMVLSLSFLVGIFVKSHNAQSAIANVLSLGLSFISGVFVQQELLSKSVLAIAHFTPTYWYVRANNTIMSLSNFSLENLLPVFSSMLIELGFAVAILSVALVISKRKQMSGS